MRMEQLMKETERVEKCLSIVRVKIGQGDEEGVEVMLSSLKDVLDDICDRIGEEATPEDELGREQEQAAYEEKQKDTLGTVGDLTGMLGP